MLFTVGSGVHRARAALILVLLAGLNGLASHSAWAAASVNLTWALSASTNVTSYAVYYGTASRAYTNSLPVGNATNLTITGLSDGVVYYFSATSIDDAGIESDYSNEVSNAPPVSGDQLPTISAIPDVTTVQDTPSPPALFTIGDPVTAASNLTLSAASSQTDLVPASNIAFGGSNSNRSITITPAAGQSGQAEITITVSDGAASASTSFALTVAAQRPPPPSAPTISAFTNVTIVQNSSTPAIPFTVGDAQVPASQLVLWAASTNLTLLPTNNFVFGGTNTDRTVSLTPVSGQSGESDVTVYVSDGSAVSLATFHLTVLPAATGPQPALTLLVSGNGIISPNLTPQRLTMGRTYTITAVPSRGQIFCGWVGSLRSTSQSLRFTMKSNLVFQAVFAPLRLAVSGVGTLSPDLRTSTNLVAGKPYTVTAVPGSGQLFAGWSGMTNSPAPRITFLMSSNVNLLATFFPNPFLPVQGSYSGLFYEDAGIRMESAGSFAVTVTSQGAYSGTLQLGPRRLTLSGQLNSQCQAAQVVTLSASNKLALSLSFGTGDQADRVWGTLAGSNWVSVLAGDRAVFTSASRTAPYAGVYTLILPGNDNDPTLPGGDSYGSVSVNTRGVASFSGTLADGTAVSQSATVSKDGFWPLYIPVYSGQGALISWMAFTNQPESDINGLLSWIKPAISNAQYYPAGFTQQCQAIGSACQQPAKQSCLGLNLTNASLAFIGGNLSAGFTNDLVAASFGSVLNNSGSSLTVSYVSTNGIFKGRVTDPATSKSLSFGGAVFQKQNAGYGSLMGTNQSSQVILSP